MVNQKEWLEGGYLHGQVISPAPKPHQVTRNGSGRRGGCGSGPRPITLIP